jgi:hypothetical protein
MSVHNSFGHAKMEPEIMPTQKRRDIANKPSEVVRQLRSTPRREGPGRPDTGIRQKFTRLEVWIDPAVHDALAWLADRTELRTGQKTKRSDVVRQALLAYVREHLPEARL